MFVQKLSGDFVAVTLFILHQITPSIYNFIVTDFQMRKLLFKDIDVTKIISLQACFLVPYIVRNSTPGLVAHTCHPVYSRDWGVRLQFQDLTRLK